MPRQWAKVMGRRVAGALGLSHLLGDCWGAQAEYLRVPWADPQKIESDLHYEQALFLSEIFPTD